jgi:hypothetical protein
MKLLDAISEMKKWAPVVELVRGMFADPEDAIKAIRAWEMAERAKTDARLQKLRERDDT